jgi:radical S-adenosyl methionine domain-containing protein 2
MFLNPPKKIKILYFCYSLLDVGVSDALDESGFDEKMFFKRGGKYEWSKADQKLDW